LKSFWPSSIYAQGGSGEGGSSTDPGRANDDDTFEPEKIKGEKVEGLWMGLSNSLAACPLWTFKKCGQTGKKTLQREGHHKQEEGDLLIFKNLWGVGPFHIPKAALTREIKE